jgi:NADPH:quinone reductase-like Zn-dependent oxidoreductase
MGLYSHHRSIGHGGTIVPCSDACGTIEKLGRNLKTHWNVGDRVLSICNQSYLAGQITAQDMSSGLGLPLPGVLATYRVFPSHGLVKPPDHLSNDEASTLPIAAVTA